MAKHKNGQAPAAAQLPPGKPILFTAKPGVARLDYEINGIAYQTSVALQLEALEFVGMGEDGLPVLRWTQRTFSDQQRLGPTSESVQAMVEPVPDPANHGAKA